MAQPPTTPVVPVLALSTRSTCTPCAAPRVACLMWAGEEEACTPRPVSQFEQDTLTQCLARQAGVASRAWRRKRRSEAAHAPPAHPAAPTDLAGGAAASLRDEALVHIDRVCLDADFLRSPLARACEPHPRPCGCEWYVACSESDSGWVVVHAGDVICVVRRPAKKCERVLSHLLLDHVGVRGRAHNGGAGCGAAGQRWGRQSPSGSACRDGFANAATGRQAATIAAPRGVVFCGANAPRAQPLRLGRGERMVGFVDRAKWFCVSETDTAVVALAPVQRFLDRILPMEMGDIFTGPGGASMGLGHAKLSEEEVGREASITAIILPSVGVDSVRVRRSSSLRCVECLLRQCRDALNTAALNLPTHGRAYAEWGVTSPPPAWQHHLCDARDFAARMTAANAGATWREPSNWTASSSGPLHPACRRRRAVPATAEAAEAAAAAGGEPLTILAGGPPCQCFSIANPANNTGAADE